MSGGLLQNLLRTGTRINTRDPGQATLQQGASINVRDFGALGDGSDDTAAIQQAMNAAAAASPRRSCYVPTGTYTVTALIWPAGLPALFGDGNDLSVLRRRAGATNSNAVLQASARDDFSIADICFDGNKANQSVAANNVQLSGCSDFQLRRVRSVRAKKVGGFGAGFVLRLLPTTNATGREALLRDCEAYENDEDGLSIQRTGAGITVDGGVYSQNAGNGIWFYDQAITPASDTVPNLAIRNLRAERNAGSGIVVSGFIVSGLGGVRTNGHGSDPVGGLVVANCQANWNEGYGIFVQATGATIIGNVTRRNGATEQAGICANAQDTVIIGNMVQGRGIATGAYFGIDAGGLRWGQVTDNVVTDVRGIGINIGAAEGVICARNVSRECGFAHINVSLYDAGARYFAWEAKDITIRENHIVNTTSASIWGVLITGRPRRVDVIENRFEWPDGLGARCVHAAVESGTVRGNRLASGTTNGYTINAAASLNIPEWIDTLHINTDTAAISSIITATQAQYIGRVSSVKVTAPGSGYTADFAVTFSGGGGTGATGMARVTTDGRVAAITFSGGDDYTSAPTVDLSAGSGSGATAVATIGLPVPWGRELVLTAFESDFRITDGATLSLPAPANATVTVRAGGLLRLRGQGGVWRCSELASGDGSLFPTRVTLPGGVIHTSGAGSPEGVLAAPVGSTYARTDGGAGTSFYVKESGTGNTGWAAK